MAPFFLSLTSLNVDISPDPSFICFPPPSIYFLPSLFFDLCSVSVPSITCIYLTSESTALHFRAFSFMVQPPPKAQGFGNHTIFLFKNKNKTKEKKITTSTHTWIHHQPFLPNSKSNHQVSFFSFKVLVFSLSLVKLCSLVFMSIISQSTAGKIERLVAESWAQAVESESAWNLIFSSENRMHLSGKNTLRPMLSLLYFSHPKDGDNVVPISGLLEGLNKLLNVHHLEPRKSKCSVMSLFLLQLCNVSLLGVLHMKLLILWVFK